LNWQNGYFKLEERNLIFKKRYKYPPSYFGSGRS